MKNISLIYGPPAAGKTTLAEKLKKNFDIYYLSVGELSRMEIKNKTNIGTLLKYYLDNDIKYPPELIFKLVSDSLNKIPNNKKCILIDGYPRFYEEITGFKNLIKENKYKLKYIINITISYNESLKRTCKRKICQNCYTQFSTTKDKCPKCNHQLIKRCDDEEHILKTRYNDFINETPKIIESLKPFFSDIKEINGEVARSVLYKNIINYFSNTKV